MNERQKSLGWPEGSKQYKAGDLTIIASQEEGRWHVSVSHPRRDPTLEELAAVRRAVVPADAYMGYVFPPPDLEVEPMIPHLVHLWEVADRGIVRDWARLNRAAVERKARSN